MLLRQKRRTDKNKKKKTKRQDKAGWVDRRQDMSLFMQQHIFACWQLAGLTLAFLPSSHFAGHTPAHVFALPALPFCFLPFCLCLCMHTHTCMPLHGWSGTGLYSWTGWWFGCWTLSSLSTHTCLPLPACPVCGMEHLIAWQHLQGMYSVGTGLDRGWNLNRKQAKTLQATLAI